MRHTPLLIEMGHNGETVLWRLAQAPGLTFLY